LPSARYTSPEWDTLERQRLWPRVWQIACTKDCVPSPGDWWEYEIAGLSVIVVRGDDGEIRAFQNACRHRGNALLAGSGQGLDEIRCPYHHWCYDLRGSLRSVAPDGSRGEVREPGTRPATSGPMGLVPVCVDTWAGFVFVNLDPECEPLSGFLEGIPQELAWVGMEQFTCERFMTVPLACNWKAVVDAFIETYHLHAVHPQMLAIADDVHTPIELLGKHSMFMQPYGVPSPRRDGSVSDQELWEEYVRNLGHRLGLPFAAAQAPGPHPAVPPGKTMRDVLVGRIREHLSTQSDAYTDLEDNRIIDDFHYHVFPNAVFNVFAGWYGLVRARPGPFPDESFLDMWNFDLPSQGRTRPRPVPVTLGPEELPSLGPVLLQDLELLPRVQQGLRQPGIDRIQLMPAEARIGRMHEVLEDYLDPPAHLRLE
jgi:nitrite reductase/ring-hydroxylating ferredoxin subunit